MCVLAYAGFLRISELLGIQTCDSVYDTAFFRIFIAIAKYDIYRDGNWVVICKSSHVTCPYTIFRRYLDFSAIDMTPVSYIFQPLSFFKIINFHKFRTGNKSLSYTTARESIGKALASDDLSRFDLGTHSLRASRATYVANKGEKGRLFKRHGRCLKRLKTFI